MAKILVMVISSDKEKLAMPINFIKNLLNSGNDIRVLFLGQNERILANDEKLTQEYKNLNNFKIFPKACLNFAKISGIENKLSQSFDLIPAGEYVSKSIEEGYQVISF
jgi:hypothetical protein